LTVPVVAFVQKEKLENLTTSQVKIFLLVVDGVDDELLTDKFIAEHLDMPLKSVRRHLRVLHKLGYTKLGEAAKGKSVAWVRDPACCWGPYELYWEFAPLN